MAIKRAKTIAEYAIRKWLEKEGFAMECFQLDFIGENEAVITDRRGDKLRLVYDKDQKTVFPSDY